MTAARKDVLSVYRHTYKGKKAVIHDVNLVFPIPDTEAAADLSGAYDAWGVHWTFEPAIQGFIPTPDSVVFEDISEWREKVNIPDVDSMDFEGYAEQVLPTLDPNKATMFFSLLGPRERLSSLMGMENSLCALLEDPDECAEFFQAVADYKIKYIRKMKEYIPIDIVRLADDCGSSNGPLLSVETWRELLKPAIGRIVEAVHELGLIYRQHSDGVTIPFIEDFVEIGIDAVDPWQACNTAEEIRKIKNQYQDRLVFVNGFDSQGVLDQPDVTESEMEAEMMRTLNLMVPGGSYLAECEVFDKSKLAVFERCVEEYNKNMIDNL